MSHQEALIVDDLKALLFFFQVRLLSSLVPAVLFHRWLTFLHRNGFQHKLAVKVRYQVALLIGNLNTLCTYGRRRNGWQPDF